MSRTFTNTFYAATLLGAIFTMTPTVVAEDKPANAVQATHSYRASTIMGTNVKNTAGEDIGHVEDLLVDLNTGRASHAILSFGGILGIGDKLFPIPWRELTLHRQDDKSYFVVDVSKDFLDKAPSFDRNQWPDVTPKWVSTVEAFFPSHLGVFVSTADNRLTMSYPNDKGEHSHAVAENATVTRDGKPAALADLQPGDTIRVTTSEQAGIHIVTKIAATSR